MDETMIIIADSKDSIAIAGIKGGKKAEVDENTVNIVIEAANFNPVSVRKTSQKTQIKTDASKRYENGITSEMAGWGMNMATALIVEVAGDKNTVVGIKKDEYGKKEEQATGKRQSGGEKRPPPGAPGIRGGDPASRVPGLRDALR